MTSDPFALFDQWLAEARATEPNDHEAMAVATADAHGLYERFGFAPVQPGTYLALLRDTAAPPRAVPGSAADDA